MPLSSDQVLINGIVVSLTEPCTVANELRKVQLVLATGGQVASTRFGDDEVHFSTADGGKLEKLITHYDTLCATGTSSSRRRGRMSVSWR